MRQARAAPDSLARGAGQTRGETALGARNDRNAESYGGRCRRSRKCPREVQLALAGRQLGRSGAVMPSSYAALPPTSRREVGQKLGHLAGFLVRIA